jgi:NitT/TauT family transport system substrate-binding protein
MKPTRCLAVLATAIVVAGCGSTATSTSTHATGSNPKATKVTIAYTAPIADQMLAPLTEAAGLFKKNGVDVKIDFLQASVALPALVSGQVQFVVVGAPSAEVSSLNGTPLQYVGQWENVIDAAIAAKGSVTSTKGLDGKTIAISSNGALSDFLVQIADQKYGIQMHEVPLGQLPNQLTAYSKGSVDSLSGVNSWQLPSLQKDVPGTHTVVNFATDQGYPGVGLVADANWLKSNGATAVPVLKALYQGVSYYKSHPAQAISVIEKNADEPAAEAKAAYDTTRALYTSSIVPVLADQTNVLKALTPTQPAAKGFAASKLMDPSYAEQAEKK